MSDQPGIPAITVFPPFSPAPRQSEPAPAAEQAQPAPEPAPSEPVSAARWDAPAPAAPMPWDFEAPGTAEEVEAAASGAQPAAGEPAAEPTATGDDDEDLPWLEVPAPRPADGGEAAPELKADDTPSWMDWVRDAGSEASAETDDGSAPAEASADAEWQAPEDGLELPEPELYDLPGVSPSDSPWSGEAAAEEGSEEPAWEMPSQAAADAPPAWESFASDTQDTPEEIAAQAESERAASPFGAVADRLEAIARTLRDDPGGFVSGAQGGGDPLALLVAGFVLGYGARPGS